MAVPSLEKVRASTNPAKEAFFTFIWDYFRKTRAWPPTATVYQQYLEKAKVVRLIGANSACIFEQQSGGQTTYQLRIMGILSTQRGREYADWLLRLLEFVRDAFYAGRAGPFGNSDVKTAIGLGENDVIELGMVLKEGFMGMYAYFAPDGSSWQFDPPKNVAEDLPKHGKLERVFDIALKRELKFFSPVNSTARMLKGATEAAQTSSLIEVMYGFGEARTLGFEHLLHPVIHKSSYSQFHSGHHREAVLNAVTGLFDFLRARTKLSLDGARLVNESLGGENPLLVLSESDFGSESAKNQRSGFHKIFLGVFEGVRNPNAHSLKNDLSRDEAAQYLVFMSLLARRLETAKRKRPQNIAAAH